MTASHKAHSDIPLQAQADEVEREAAARVVGIAKNIEPLPANGEVGKGRTIDRYNNSNTYSCDVQGNDPAYLAARIARDRPDILERMKAGEYKPPINSKYEKLFRAQLERNLKDSGRSASRWEWTPFSCPGWHVRHLSPGGTVIYSTLSRNFVRG